MIDTGLRPSEIDKGDLSPILEYVDVSFYENSEHPIPEGCIQESE